MQLELDAGRHQYRRVVMALTEKDLLLFQSVPWTYESWTSPLLTHPLLATRSNPYSSKARCTIKAEWALSSVFEVQCLFLSAGWFTRAASAALRLWVEIWCSPHEQGPAGASSLTCFEWRHTGICPHGHAQWCRGDIWLLSSSKRFP